MDGWAEPQAAAHALSNGLAESVRRSGFAPNVAMLYTLLVEGAILSRSSSSKYGTEFKARAIGLMLALLEIEDELETNIREFGRSDGFIIWANGGVLIAGFKFC